MDPQSNRLQLLQPFNGWNGKELKNLLVLVKVKGKCTTDHISAAGPWLKYKGHLDNIANNTLIGAVNAETNQVNVVKNQLSKTAVEGSIPDVAREYKKAGQNWAVVADHNYGEGSAREHAALQPRYLGGSLIIAKSFARIHETNLKKQGMLPLTFVDPMDYEKIPAYGCVISTSGLVNLVNKRSGEIRIQLKNRDDGSMIGEIPMKHTMSADQLEWFKHGSALNMIKEQLSK